MKYVKILFAVALVFTLCSGVFVEKGDINPFMPLGYRLHLPIR